MKLANAPESLVATFYAALDDLGILTHDPEDQEALETLWLLWYDGYTNGYVEGQLEEYT